MSRSSCRWHRPRRARRPDAAGTVPADHAAAHFDTREFPLPCEIPRFLTGRIVARRRPASNVALARELPFPEPELRLPVRAARTVFRSHRREREDIVFLETIVVPVDFGPASHAAWRTACDLARIGGSRLHLVHVCAEPVHQAWAGEADVDMEGMAQEWALEAAEHIAGFASPGDVDEARVTRTVVRGCAHREIVEFARTRAADLIVMGTHGYGPLRRLLLGSVTERVLRTAPCPVMAVRPPEMVAVLVPAEAARRSA
jgi:nucleotide-binding universal stress UspA family protein